MSNLSIYAYTMQIHNCMDGLRIRLRAKNTRLRISMKQAIATVARFVVVQPCCRPLRRCRCWAIAGNSHCAPIVLPWRFPETFKKRFAARSVTKSKEFQLRAWLPKSSEKYRVFLIFMQKCVVLLSKIDVFRFLEPPGGPDDHMKSGWPKKVLKSLAFLILFFGS